MIFKEFSNRKELDDGLANDIANMLSQDIATIGDASLLVSGGSTPIDMFEVLSKIKIEWSNIKIGLVDERFVEIEHNDSNEKLVKEHLVINEASGAKLEGLVYDISSMSSNLNIAESHASNSIRTCVVLGMGTDGHTASLFPSADNLNKGLNRQPYNNQLISVEAKGINHKRISHTYKALINTKRLILHITGEEKLRVFEEAKVSDLTYPISAFIHQGEVGLEVYWSE